MQYRIIIPADQNPTDPDVVSEAWLGKARSVILTERQLHNYITEFTGTGKDNRFYVEKVYTTP